jgi:hypothetical protein
MTADELDALPVGPFVRRRREATIEEARKKGCRWIEWEEARPVIASFPKEGEPMFYVDSSGERWTIGQWADGQKFKERLWVL